MDSEGNDMEDPNYKPRLQNEIPEIHNLLLENDIDMSDNESIVSNNSLPNLLSRCDSSSSSERRDEQEMMEANAIDDHVDEEVSPKKQPKNSPLIFAIPIDPNDSGKKAKVKCWLCNKVMQKDSFYMHMYAVHTTNGSWRKKVQKGKGVN